MLVICLLYVVDCIGQSKHKAGKVKQTPHKSAEVKGTDGRRVVVVGNDQDGTERCADRPSVGCVRLAYNEAMSANEGFVLSASGCKMPSIWKIRHGCREGTTGRVGSSSWPWISLF